MTTKHGAIVLALASTLIGCTAADADGGVEESDVTSKTATFLELAFTGEVIGPATESATQRKKSVVAQLFYLAGELDKVHGGHGRFGYVELDATQVEPAGEGLERLRYEARLPVAWPKSRAVPARYRVVVPRRVDRDGLDAFNTKYNGKCGPTKYGADALWYDFQPIGTGCALDAADVLDVQATVKRHPLITSDRRPEIERFWDDGVFRFVVVHGTDGASSTASTDDAGVREYLDFQRRVREAYPGGTATSGPKTSDVYDDWTFEAAVPALDGSDAKLVVVTLLTAGLGHIGASFDERYGPLSADADYVSYAGHSGLGKNIAAMADKEQVSPQHYQIYFLDGCSTFAYLDSSLADRRIATNGADVDPHGTKFLDLVVNAQPAPWYTGADSQWTLLRHLSGRALVGYDKILEDLSQSAVPVVAGEEDNPAVE
jgi:hypothetical protein